MKLSCIGPFIKDITLSIKDPKIPKKIQKDPKNITIHNILHYT